jgi:hypothetical protein
LGLFVTAAFYDSAEGKAEFKSKMSSKFATRKGFSFPPAMSIFPPFPFQDSGRKKFGDIWRQKL